MTVRQNVSVEFDSEQPVIEAIQAGDTEAMRELIDRHGRWVRGVIYGVLGRIDELDDVAQSVWMRVWREAKQLNDIANWRAWLYRIARNTATDYGRARQRRKRLIRQAAEFADMKKPAVSREDRVSADERQRIMLEAIDKLPPLYREPFVLKHMEDRSYKEIAELLGVPADTVETRLVRARRRLRKELAGRI